MKRRKFFQEVSKRAMFAASASMTLDGIGYGAAHPGGIGISVGTAPPEISDRGPRTDEIGYLPREAATVDTNPPALAWLPEPGAEAYAVQFARNAEFSSGVLTISKTPYVLYTHTTTLAPGTWWWRYASVDGQGAQSNWSKIRNFTIAADAQPFPRPSDELIEQRIPATHPRLLLRPEEVKPLYQACLSSQKERWEKFLSAAEEYLLLPLIPEPPPYTGGKFSASEWRTNYTNTLKAVAAAETLALCYRLSGEKRFGEGARKWLLHIAAWNPAGTTSLKVNDECGMPILYGTSRAYDWAYEALGDSDRAAMQAMIRARGEEAYKKLHGAPHEQKAYDSHQGRLWHFLGEASIAYYGEVPEARKWLDYAFTIFWGWYPAFGDADGGWSQGLSYWQSYVLRSTWWLDVLQAAMNIDGTKKPFYRHVGDFSIYVAPPGGAVVGFADYGEDRPGQTHELGYVEPGMRGLGSIDAYFARRCAKPEWQWYAEQLGHTAFPPTTVGFLRSLRPDPPAPQARPPIDWPKAKWFRGVGWVTLHTDLVDGRQVVEIIMRSSPLGNISHSHADQNAIVVGAYGSPLLVNTGIRPWWGSPFFWDWYVATKAHNALEINGKGQPKTELATGKVIVFQPGDSHDYVVGDASPAYTTEVERYRRHLVFLKPDVLIIVDEVMAKTPASLKFLLHGRAPFIIDAPTGRIGLTFERASLAGYLQAPGGLEITQTDKYTMPPELGHPAPEWHLSAETNEKREVAYVIAVLGIAKAGGADSIVSEVKHSTDGNIVSVAFRRSGKPTTVAIDTAAPAVHVA